MCKERTALNKELFNNAKITIDDPNNETKYDKFGLYHIGWYDISKYIDWLEKNYTIIKKTKKQHEKNT